MAIAQSPHLSGDGLTMPVNAQQSYANYATGFREMWTCERRHGSSDPSKPRLRI